MDFILFVYGVVGVGRVFGEVSFGVMRFCFGFGFGLGVIFGV